MSEFRDRIKILDKDIKKSLKDDYGIDIKSKWRNKTYFYFGKSIPYAANMDAIETIEYVHKNIDQFAYFIHGMRAIYNVENRPWLNKGKNYKKENKEQE